MINRKELTDRILHTLLFTFNGQDNGGEALSLATRFLHNGDLGPQGMYVNQEITLQSYCNCAKIQLFGAPVDSAMLRKLADELDRAKIVAENVKAALEAEIPV